MSIDRSEGWDGIAEQFMTARSGVGAGLVRSWARDHLPPSATVVDVGCGSGVPIAQALVEEGFTVFGIDASPRLIAAFRSRFPDAPSACEPAQDSAFFHRRFDAAVSVGLLFLLSADDQHKLLRRVADALEPGGRFLFSAPREPCEWPDALTGRRSMSLGERTYRRLLEASGLCLIGCSVDEGENNYFDAVKPLVQTGATAGSLA
jgi:SAM-dependent methyltransferase